MCLIVCMTIAMHSNLEHTNFIRTWNFYTREQMLPGVNSNIK